MIDYLVREWNDSGIVEGDIVLLHSSLNKTVRKYLKKYKYKFSPRDILESFIKAVGEEGTLIIPLFNFDFTKGVPFDICNTVSHMGALTEAARIYPKSVRTGHPVYSFAVIGQHSSEFEDIDNFSAYGNDSPFAKLKELGGKIAVLGLSDQDSMTFYHFVEESIGVKYRYHKLFHGDYINKMGEISKKTYNIYVRDIGRSVETNVNRMGEFLWENSFYKGSKYNEGTYLRTILATDLYEQVEKVIRDGKASNYLYSISDNDYIGKYMYELASELFPICRSLTGNGVRATLDILRREISDLKIFEVSTGTKCFDWHVPEEWNIRDAYIKSPNGKKIIDFNKSNLHVVGYSEPINTKISLENLQDHLYSLPNQPDAIPYVTSYYKKQWGFSLAHNQRKNLSPGEYEVFIDSDHKSGSLTYGEIVIKGESDKEVFLSTYICHPSMANNELSGPVVTSALIKWIKSLKKTLYTYRIIFVPETIGAIVYLSKNMSVMKLNTVAGFNITCVGDDREYSYLPSRDGNTLSDRISKHVLKYLVGDYKAYSFLERGSDERQYCSPGVDLPVASIMRSKYHTYPEYHTSKDDLTFISPAGLFGSYNVLKYCLDCIEKNKIFKVKVLCEPQLGKRGLYPDTSIKGSAVSADTIMNFLAYCDGNVDLLCIADKINEPMWNLFDIVDSLLEADLIEIVS